MSTFGFIEGDSARRELLVDSTIESRLVGSFYWAFYEEFSHILDRPSLILLVKISRDFDKVISTNEGIFATKKSFIRYMFSNFAFYRMYTGFTLYDIAYLSSWVLTSCFAFLLDTWQSRIDMCSCRFSCHCRISAGLGCHTDLPLDTFLTSSTSVYHTLPCTEWSNCHCSVSPGTAQRERSKTLGRSYCCFHIQRASRNCRLERNPLILPNILLFPC